MSTQPAGKLADPTFRAERARRAAAVSNGNRAEAAAVRADQAAVRRCIERMPTLTEQQRSQLGAALRLFPKGGR